MSTELVINTTYHSPNSSDRGGAKVDTIIIHHTAGSLMGDLRWLCSPESKVSAHYVISRAGEVFRLVDDSRAAWHAGRSSWNYYGVDVGGLSINRRSIGIELEGSGDFSVKQLTALYLLVTGLMLQYHIPAGLVLGHKEIAPGRKTDPAMDMDRFREKLP
jgi:N-acetylmuramoyl-L-alanine amidase